LVTRRWRFTGGRHTLVLAVLAANTRLGARVDDNATARALAGQLPLTLTVRDHNGVEQTAPLPRPLTTDGHDPAAGDIGDYAPGRDFVLSYDDTRCTSAASCASASSKATWKRADGSPTVRPSRSTAPRRWSRASPTITAVAKPTGPIEPCGCRRVACPVLSRACCLDVKR
jgi:hypothetical protein